MNIPGGHLIPAGKDIASSDARCWDASLTGFPCAPATSGSTTKIIITAIPITSRERTAYTGTDTHAGDEKKISIPLLFGRREGIRLLGELFSDSIGPENPEELE